MNSKVGGKQVIFTGSYYVPKGEQLEINVQFDDLGEPDDIPLKFEFVNRGEDEDPKVSLEFELEEGVGLVRIVNPRGTFIVPDGPPAQIAKSNSGRQVWMVFAVKTFKNFYQTDIQMTIDGVADES